MTKNDLDDLPGWYGVARAGRVEPPDPAVLARAQAAVQEQVRWPATAAVPVAATGPDVSCS